MLRGGTQSMQGAHLKALKDKLIEKQAAAAAAAAAEEVRRAARLDEAQEGWVEARPGRRPRPTAENGGWLCLRQCCCQAAVRGHYNYASNDRCFDCLTPKRQAMSPPAVERLPPDKGAAWPEEARKKGPSERPRAACLHRPSAAPMQPREEAGNKRPRRWEGMEEVLVNPPSTPRRPRNCGRSSREARTSRRTSKLVRPRARQVDNERQERPREPLRPTPPAEACHNPLSSKGSSTPRLPLERPPS